MKRFRPVGRHTSYLFPPSIDEWLPEEHLAQFIAEVVDGLDIGALEKAYASRGSAAYHPSVLLSLLVYGYATGVFSSRKIERAAYDSVAFRFIAAGTPPDPDTLASFRRRFLDEWASLFVQVLGTGARDEAAEAGHDQPGWDEGQSQRLAPQRAIARAHRENWKDSSRKK
jgi:transposase